MTTAIDAAKAAAEFNHHDPGQSRTMPQVLDAIRDQCPVAHSEQLGGFWLATRYADLQRVLQETDTFSSKSVTVPSFLWESLGIIATPPINLDGTAHRDFRRIVLPAFTPGSINRWEDRVRQTCRDALAGFVHRGECDAAHDYARKIPTTTMAQMLGIPPSDLDTFTSWIHRLVETAGEDPPGAIAAAKELLAYFREHLTAHRLHPQDDLLTTLINAEYEGESLSEIDLLGFLFLMITAGMDTVWSVLGDSLCHLAQHPDQQAILAADPAAIPVAAEELLRFYTPAVLGRVVTEDTTLRDQELKAGETLMVCYPAANRDPEAFDRADEVVLDRQPNRHLGFGLGVHRCLGVSLARLQLRVGLEEWLAQIPRFWLTDPDAVRWSAGPVRGPRDLPIGFPAR